ncbi:response regulator [Kriegella aquimaris]|uniref:Response regulator receiver domain-containing protein n=1 Tax=Kriegella aquimaris TaxID=192904 RepID=A0A1G9KEQ2_9FLAO|nr:response regulator [Kriegella aquimaris]SDL47833.1 Response regulator receiver domain-containing protein [Kriegella aquimaris]
MSKIEDYKGIDVLLIEDDPIANSLVTIALRQLGVIDVNAVENGLEALEFLDSNKPDLIFLDINMPEMNGFEFLSFIEENDFILESSIVMLTSSVLTRDRTKALGFSSVVDYIEKPMNRDRMESLLVKIMEKKESK